MIGRGRLVLLALTVVGVARIAEAQSTRDEAKLYFDAGVGAFEAGQFPAAIQAFEKAYRLAPHPAIVFSEGQAYKRQFFVDGNPDNARRAVERYRTYLDQVPQGGRRSDAAQALGDMEMALARLTPTAEPAGVSLAPRTRIMVSSWQTGDARVSLDGSSPAPAPLIQEVQPGKHTVIVSAEGHAEQRREILALEGELVAADVPLSALPGMLTITGPAGAALWIDGRTAGTLPRQPVEMPAGRHRVVAAENGRAPWSVALDLGRGETKALRVELHDTTQRRVAYGLLGACAVGLVTSGVFAGLALESQSDAMDIESQARTHNISADLAGEHDTDVAKRNQLRTDAWVALGASAAVGATGLFLFLFDSPPLSRESSSTPAPLSFEPTFAPRFAGFSVNGRM